MISCCANPDCGKPLHYLREGRIYVFDNAARNLGGGKSGAGRLEHYWLCGACIETLVLSQDGQGQIHLLPRRRAVYENDDSRAPGSWVRMVS